MKIAIINLSSRDKEFDQYGTAGELIIRWLAPNFPDAKLIEVYVANGVSLPSPQDYDGYILSGSEKGVYDPVYWIEPLKLFLINLRDKNIPVFGICFGHQIMADTFGGSACMADKGFVVGAREYRQGQHRFSAYAMHRDQVVDVPPGATVTATSPYCPVAALDYDFPAQSVQFHPEFKKPLVAGAINLFTGNLLTAEEASESKESIADKDVAPDLYAMQVVDFFKKTLQYSQESAR